MVVTSSAQVVLPNLFPTFLMLVQMFAERFIVYTQTVDDVNGTVMERVFKMALDIPGINMISIAMHSMTTDRCTSCSPKFRQHMRFN
jgi:hypothetical protein